MSVINYNMEQCAGSQENLIRAYKLYDSMDSISTNIGSFSESILIKPVPAEISKFYQKRRRYMLCSGGCCGLFAANIIFGSILISFTSKALHFPYVYYAVVPMVIIMLVISIVSLTCARYYGNKKY